MSENEAFNALRALNHAIDVPSLSLPAKIVLIALIRFTSYDPDTKRYFARAKIATLAERCVISDRAVRYALAELAELPNGVITVTRGRYLSEYEVRSARLADLASRAAGGAGLEEPRSAPGAGQIGTWCRPDRHPVPVPPYNTSLQHPSVTPREEIAPLALATSPAKMVTKPGPKLAKAADPASADVKAIVACYWTAFEAAKGAKPTFRVGRTDKAAKRLLDELGTVDAACEVVRTAMTNEWTARNRCELWEIAADSNKHRGTAPKGKPRSVRQEAPAGATPWKGIELPEVGS